MAGICLSRIIWRPNHCWELVSISSLPRRSLSSVNISRRGQTVQFTWRKQWRCWPPPPLLLSSPTSGSHSTTPACWGARQRRVLARSCRVPTRIGPLTWGSKSRVGYCKLGLKWGSVHIQYKIRGQIGVHWEYNMQRDCQDVPGNRRWQPPSAYSFVRWAGHSGDSSFSLSGARILTDSDFPGRICLLYSLPTPISACLMTRVCVTPLIVNTLVIRHADIFRKRLSRTHTHDSSLSFSDQIACCLPFSLCHSLFLSHYDLYIHVHTHFHNLHTCLHAYVYAHALTHTFNVYSRS